MSMCVCNIIFVFVVVHRDIRENNLGFGVRSSVENSQQNELYEYPNTYHLHGTPSMNHNESKSADSNEDNNQLQSRHSLKHIFHKKSKKKNKTAKNPKHDSDSDHSSDNPKSMRLQKHSSVKHAHSSPLQANESNSSLFASEQQPLMQSVSDPHVISHLPGAGHISDNSKRTNNHAKSSSTLISKHNNSKNPNYRLSQSNNLSNIPNPHHHFNDDDADIRYSPQSSANTMIKVYSNSALYEDEPHTVVEIEEVKAKIKVNAAQKVSNQNKQKNEGDAQKKHVYKSKAEKRRTQSLDVNTVRLSEADLEKDDAEKLHTYTTPNTSNVTDV